MIYKSYLNFKCNPLIGNCKKKVNTVSSIPPGQGDSENIMKSRDEGAEFHHTSHVKEIAGGDLRAHIMDLIYKNI